jgi:Dyp-type peroxidase family
MIQITRKSSAFADKGKDNLSMPMKPPDLTFDLQNSEPLDETTPDARDLLEKLQGNILKGHGRDFGAYIFFRFRDDPAGIRKHLGELSRYVTSAYRQYRDAETYRKWKIPGDLFGMLVLSAAGYRYLGLQPETFGERHQDGILSNFAEGLKAHAVEDFADPPVDAWEEPYREEIHAMLLLADDDRDHLLRETGRAVEELRGHNEVLGVELGQALRDDKDRGVEHFGFVDGRSQPLYLKTDFKYDDAGKNRIGDGESDIHIWDPFEPLHRVLVADPIMRNTVNCFGSYLVFRKLEQNVQGFRKREQDLANRLALIGEERARAGAMAIGRFRDGTPLAVSGHNGHQPEEENNFAYNHLPNGGDDTQGHRCPLQAHIRKVNPRGDRAMDFKTGAAQIERQHRVARRGISYGERVPHPGGPENLDELPSSGVGLLFMCFQANIPIQFAFLQKDWCNNPHLETERISKETGIDPVIGQANVSTAVPLWSRQYQQEPSDRFEYSGFVRMKGGEFFFAPSILFFQMLKA